MPADAFDLTTLTAVMERFGNYACLRTQKLCAGTFVPPQVALCLGLRESGLRNICGGAKFVGGHWVPTKTDRGWLQIADTISENRAYLASVPGCPDGTWVPEHKAAHVTALNQLHCPTLSAALEYTLTQFIDQQARAIAAGVKFDDALRFCIAAHNAGFTGALTGYREGDVDKYTTLGDYSAWVLRYANDVSAWITARPKWTLK